MSLERLQDVSTVSGSQRSQVNYRTKEDMTLRHKRFLLFVSSSACDLASRQAMKKQRIISFCVVRAFCMFRAAAAVLRPVRTMLVTVSSLHLDCSSRNISSAQQSSPCTKEDGFNRPLLSLRMIRRLDVSSSRRVSRHPSHSCSVNLLLMPAAVVYPGETRSQCPPGWEICWLYWELEHQHAAAIFVSSADGGGLHSSEDSSALVAVHLTWELFCSVSTSGNALGWLDLSPPMCDACDGDSCPVS
ncbi:uncharacterized protein LOC135383872 isoform X2 [Ornithodoros turicata]|uniref:uncharacterized protein LOC135383872 isoform X2 n=1 Tax=Ornithodoros turicata TaxID=34597 RepID=UPI003139DDD6